MHDEQMQNAQISSNPNPDIDLASEPSTSEPSDEETARPDVTDLVTRGVCRFLIGLGYAPLTEFKLANGRRADIVGVDRKGRIIMVEVKSCRADFEVDQKWTDYVGFCDAFYFAVDANFPVELLPVDQGLIIADSYGGAIMREANSAPLPAARRKAVTLRLTRQALTRHYQSLDDRR